MIEVTDEMVEAVCAVAERAWRELEPDVARDVAAAVLAIVERDMRRYAELDWAPALTDDDVDELARLALAFAPLEPRERGA